MKTRSDVAVASALMNTSEGNSALTTAHAPPSFTLENVVTPSHATQVRSAVAEPSFSRPKPAAHVRHAVHAWLPGVALKVPPAQAAHSRSDDAPGATVWY